MLCQRDPLCFHVIPLMYHSAPILIHSLYCGDSMHHCAVTVLLVGVTVVHFSVTVLLCSFTMLHSLALPSILLLHSFLPSPWFIQLCSSLLHRRSVTGAHHSPIGVHFIFSSALSAEQTCTFGISALEILRLSLLLPQMETSVSLQKNSTFSCNLNPALY